MLRRRFAVLFFIFLLTISLLALRLGQIGVGWGSELTRQAVNQRAVTYPLQSPRGQILDRNLVTLTAPEYHYSLVAFPSLLRDPRQTMVLLEQELDQSSPDLLTEVAGKREPLVIRRALTNQEREGVTRLALPGLVVIQEEERYGQNSLARHLVGYVSADGHGLAGLEKEFDHYLYRGWAPSLAAFVDGKDNLIPKLGYRLQTRGFAREPKDLVLSLDARIQQIVEGALDKAGVAKGAAVVLDAADGGILAMASRPNFEQDEVTRYLSQDRTAPLLNRAVEAFQPGSIFKLVVLAGGLEEKRVGLNDLFFCPGYQEVGGLRFGCYRSEGHGQVTLRDAFAQSCNVTFIQLGLKLGSEVILKYARVLGLGQKTAIGLGHEATGLLPESAGLTIADLANLSLGQGQLLVTPLQVAQLTQAIANDGLLIPAHLIEEVRTSQGMALFRPQRAPSRRVISRQTAARLREAMRAVTESGTGQLARVAEGGAAGKTGSAETGPAGVAHAWFTGFAPTGRPRYVVTVLVEEGGSGGERAAPIFRQIVEGIIASLR